MKHEIEIPDLPEGWEAVAYRVPEEGEYYFSRHGFEQATDEWPDRPAAIIVRKKQPRRIVLEEVEDGFGKVEFFHDRRYWKIVEDNKCAE